MSVYIREKNINLEQIYLWVYLRFYLIGVSISTFTLLDV